MREKVMDRQMKNSNIKISLARSGNSLYRETSTVINMNEEAVNILAF
jgi:hypothetical protein